MLNKIIVMGRLVRDPESKPTASGISCAAFTLACERDYVPQGQERETDFLDCVAWRGTADFALKHFTKGRMAVVEGRLQIRDWTDRDGNKRRSAEVIADNVYFGDSKRDAAEAGGAYAPPSGGYAAPAAMGGYSAPSDGYSAPMGGDQFAELSDDDGELPF